MKLQESNDAFDRAFDKMAASAFQGSGPAFDDLEAAPEVEGHIVDDKAYAASAFQDSDPAFDDLEAAAEVEGHQAVGDSSPSQDAGTASDDGTAEVEGHLHPILMEDYSRAQVASSEAAIARAQRASEARTDRDGGVLDKILRRKSK